MHTQLSIYPKHLLGGKLQLPTWDTRPPKPTQGSSALAQTVSRDLCQDEVKASLVIIFLETANAK